MKTKELARLGAFAGVLAPVLFTIGFTVAGFLKPDHSPVRDVISDLGVGPYAWIQNTNFSVTGVLLVAFAFTFYQRMRPVLTRSQLTVTGLLLVLSGLGFLVAAYFHVPSPDDPPALRMREGLLHMAGFLTIFVPFIVALLIVGWRLRHEFAWQRLGWYSLVTAIAAFVLATLLFIVANPALPLQLGGVVSRILIVQTLAWHAVVGWRFLRDGARPSTRPSPL
jgi:hypothetical membrane protein